MKTVKNIIIIVLFCVSLPGKACTIFCAKDKDEHIWAANNEDNAFSFVNFINVFPKTEDTKYGYYTLSYFTEKNGENFNIHGGMNEAGLFYDFNSIPTTIIKNLHKKNVFPEGSQKILSHILANFERTEQVVELFEKYWFEVGFNSAQMHVADKFGTFAIIGPSGSRILKNKKYQISTNFDICGKEDSSSCWRYPIALEKLEMQEIGLESFVDICQSTSQKGVDGNYTIYSNIQNLNTGEIWFYFLSDYKNPYKTTLKQLLAKGRKSYLIRDLFNQHPLTLLYNDFYENGGQSAFRKYEKLDLVEERKKEILSIFVNTILGKNYDMEAFPFLEEYLTYNPIGYWMRAARAIYYFQKGDTEKAVSIIKKYKAEVPQTSMNVVKILKLFDGEFQDDVNVTIELNGFQNARHVFVKGIPVDFDFLIKKNGKWIGKFKLNPGIYNYTFVADGKEVFDGKTPVKIVSSAFEDPYRTHQLCIGFSEEQYQTTITVNVPDKNDVVYIAGNQKNIGNWNSVFRLKEVSRHKREITLYLHYPAKFKFTRGNWDTEAIIYENKKDSSGNWLPIEVNKNTHEFSYSILNWKDRIPGMNK